MDDVERNELKLRVLEVLKKHQGPDNCILMCDLFVMVTGDHIIPMKKTDQSRIIRSLVKQLREEGHPIGNKPSLSGGYFMATCDEELDSTIKHFHNRGISSFKQEAALKRTTPSAVMTQCIIELEDKENSNNGES